MAARRRYFCRERLALLEVIRQAFGEGHPRSGSRKGTRTSTPHAIAILSV
jgi:hypothetical protein